MFTSEHRATKRIASIRYQSQYYTFLFCCVSRAISNLFPLAYNSLCVYVTWCDINLGVKIHLDIILNNKTGTNIENIVFPVTFKVA